MLGIAAVTIHFVFSDHSNNEHSVSKDDASALVADKLSSTDTVLQARLSDNEYAQYFLIMNFITKVVSGLGLEVFGWYYCLQTWDEGREALWMLAQFVFPLLFITVSLGLAIHHNYLSLLILVPVVWKFGFPRLSCTCIWVCSSGTVLGYSVPLTFSVA